MEVYIACRYNDSIDHRADRFVTNGGTMSVVAYVLLTVAVFAVLGYAQKLVEKL
jgi:hypothetical protein